MDQAFRIAFDDFADVVHSNARAKGFWDTDRNNGEAIALMHSELSELLEALRTDTRPSEKIPGYTHAEEELADLVVRAMDFARGRGLDLSGAIVAKHHYNTTRPYKHGKKF